MLYANFITPLPKALDDKHTFTIRQLNELPYKILMSNSHSQSKHKIDYCSLITISFLRKLLTIPQLLWQKYFSLHDSFY